MQSVKTGVTWKPWVGAGVGSESVTADCVWQTTGQFSAIGQTIELFAANGGSVVLTGTPEVLTVADVTGSSAAEINGDYQLQPGLYNAFPWWQQSESGASIRRDGVNWKLTESGTPRLASANYLAMPFSNGAIWFSTSAAGVMIPGQQLPILTTEGAQPALGGFQGRDFQGADLPLPADLTVRATEIICTAGEIVVSSPGGTSMLAVLPVGGRLALFSPGDVGLSDSPFGSYHFSALTADAAFTLVGASALVAGD